MDRRDLVQQLINRRKFKTYLEIGVLGGYVFFDIKCKRKIAVDPHFKFNWKGRLGETLRNKDNLRAQFFEETSDDFFAKHAQKVFAQDPIDIVLIDGMHEFKFALNDVLNSLKYLSPNGVIVMHDCNPRSVEDASSFQEWKNRNFSGFWNGDVWKCFPYLQATRSDLFVFVADCDHGLGVVERGENPALFDHRFSSFDFVDELGYHDLAANRQTFLNLKPEAYLDTFIRGKREP